MKYVIKDWTNKICFGGQCFASFEDAWGFIYEADPAPDEDDPHGYDDYFVVQVNEVKP